MLLEKLETTDFGKIYSIMETSFPDDERRPYDEQKQLLNNPLYSIYVSRDITNENIEGFVCLWEFEEIAFIEHIAVAPTHRNKGIGAKMLHSVSEMTKKPVCLEVEPPENEISARRIEFYKRNNFFLNEYEYIQPPISKGKQPIQLYIMTSGKAISESEFENIRNLLYTEVYNVK